MREQHLKVLFDNKSNPGLTFDLMRLEELYKREVLDHNPEHPHKVDFYILLFITSGKGYHTVDFTEYELNKGTIITIRKDQIHQLFRSSDATGYMLLFTDEFLVSYFEESASRKALLLFNELLGGAKIQLDDESYGVMLDIIHRMVEEYDRIMDDHSLSIIRSELHILISKLYRIKSNLSDNSIGKKYLSQFIAFQNLVEEHAFTTKRVGDYAKMMTVSSKTLNTYSRSIIDKSAKEFIDEICIKQIKRLLINTSLSIKEIAYDTGHEETTNFYKYFKHHVGMTPESYRETSIR